MTTYRVCLEYMFAAGDEDAFDPRQCAVRYLDLPFAPFPGLIIQTENEEFFPEIDRVWWSIPHGRFHCLLKLENCKFKTVEQAIECLGEGWRMHSDEDCMHPNMAKDEESGTITT